ncbi:MAG: fumarylacetoacetate hydrolase family protein [Gammaproteobacteria bacterium]|nr:fumarylacetoacetate hydrolase family protein [Gammaproteobacteria bacterium]
MTLESRASSTISSVELTLHFIERVERHDADTVGPVMARGVDYNDLLLQSRLNGKVMQSQRTSDLVFDSAALVSYISRYVTLKPGDMIFTGTPGSTAPMQPGDVIEIELENVGTLRNTIGEKGTRP